MATKTVLRSIGHAFARTVSRLARNGVRQCPRFLIAVAALVGVLATFCAGAQSSTGTVKWGAGNGYPPGPYSSPDAACASALNGLRGTAEGWGPNAYYLYSDAVANPAGWDLTPIGGHPYSATYCNFTETIYDCGSSCPYEMQITNGLPYVYAISPAKVDDIVKIERVMQLKVDTAELDARAAIAHSDRRLLAVKGITVEVPGVDASVATLREQYGLRILEGTSDAIKGPQDRLINGNARNYAKKYNRIIVSANTGS